MIVDITDENWDKIIKIVKSRNKKLAKELEDIKPLEMIEDSNLIKARSIKTERVKNRIREAIKNLRAKETTPSKYKVHKETGIAYTTLSKYFDEIIKEV